MHPRGQELQQRRHPLTSSSSGGAAGQAYLAPSVCEGREAREASLALSRKGYSIWQGALAGFLQDRGKHGAAAVVVKSMASESMESAGLICRMVGGYLLGCPSLVADTGSPPPFLKYEPALGKAKEIWLSEGFRAQAPQEAEVILAAFSAGAAWKELASLKEAKRAYQTYKSEKGERSRPWVRVRCIVSEGEKHSLCKTVGQEYPNMLVLFKAFLSECTSVDRGATLPSSW